MLLRWLRTSIRRIVLLGFIGGLSVLSAQAQGRPSIPPCSGLRWIVNSGSLKASQIDFPLEWQRQYFDSPCTFLVMPQKPTLAYQDWSAVRTRTITSLENLDQAVADPSVRAILYDPEAWEMTTRNEQENPVDAACRAAEAAHAHGKIAIATPAINLIRFLDPASARGGRRFDGFESTKVAGGIARCVDVYEIQAQGAEKDTTKFRQFVETEARQARAANPRVIVLAGISTNPSGQQVTPEELFKAVESVRNLVDGFWLNIPAGGKYCPNCGTPRPKVAVQMLQMLDRR